MADSPEDTPAQSPDAPSGAQPSAGDSGGQPAGPGGGGSADKKGLSPLAWVLIVLGVIFVLMMGSCVACGVVATRMVKQAASDFEDNPTKAAAELAVRMNPELELVDSDDEAGTLTIRNTETGEESTFDFSEVADGKFSFSGKEGDASLSLGEDGLTATGPDGEVTRFGTGAVEDVPDWAMRYPGADVVGAGSSTDADGAVTGAFQMTTDDAPETVIERLTELLQQGGYELTSTTTAMGTTLSAHSTDPDRTLTYFIVAGDSGTMITAQYSGSP